jgi:FkbM family methyltransferase
MVGRAVGRGLVALMDRAPAWIAMSFETSTRLTRVVRPLVNPLLPKALTTVQVRAGAARGMRLRIDPRREKYYWTGLYENAVQDAFVGLLHPGATVWDIGAHIGFFTGLAARCVGPEGLVHAFEPMPANRMRLLDTVEMNQLKQVQVHAVAVAERTGTRHLYANPSTSMSSLVCHAGARTLEVSTVALDELLECQSYGIPSLVKIDAEGSELEILRGGLHLLAIPHVALLVEFNDATSAKTASALFPARRLEQLSKAHWLVRGAS